MADEDPLEQFLNIAPDEPPPAPPPLPENNYDAANSELSLTPEEQYLYGYHLNNLQNAGNGGGFFDPEGRVSTLLQTSPEIDGKTYNLPTVWDGAQHTEDEAVAHARELGLENFPAYGSRDEAEARYQAMHTFMDRDKPPRDHNLPEAPPELAQAGLDQLLLADTLMKGTAPSFLNYDWGKKEFEAPMPAEDQLQQPDMKIGEDLESGSPGRGQYDWSPDVKLTPSTGVHPTPVETQLGAAPSVDPLEEHFLANKKPGDITDEQEAIARANEILAAEDAGDVHLTPEMRKELEARAYAGTTPGGTLGKTLKGFGKAIIHPGGFVDAAKGGLGAAAEALREVGEGAGPDKAASDKVAREVAGGLNAVIPDVRKFGNQLATGAQNLVDQGLPGSEERRLARNAESNEFGYQMSRDVKGGNETLGANESDPLNETVRFIGQSALPVGGVEKAAAPLIAKAADATVENAPKVAKAATMFGVKRVAPFVGGTLATGTPLGGFMAAAGVPATTKGIYKFVKALVKSRATEFFKPAKTSELSRLVEAIDKAPNQVPLYKYIRQNLEDEAARLERVSAKNRLDNAGKLHPRIDDPDYELTNIDGVSKTIRQDELAAAGLRRDAKALKWKEDANKVLTYFGKRAAGTVGHAALGGATLGGLAAAGAQPQDVESAAEHGFYTGADLALLGAPKAEAHGREALRLERGGKAFAEGSKLEPKHLDSLGLDEPLKFHMDQLSGALDRFGRWIKPVSSADFAKAVAAERSQPAATGSKASSKPQEPVGKFSPGWAYTTKDGNIIINADAVKTGVGNHEFRHAMQKSLGVMLEKSDPEFMRAFEDEYLSRLKKNVGKEDFNSQAERDAEVARIVLSKTPLGYFYGGEQGVDVLRRIRDNFAKKYMPKWFNSPEVETTEGGHIPTPRSRADLASVREDLLKFGEMAALGDRTRKAAEAKGGPAVGAPEAPPSGPQPGTPVSMPPQDISTDARKAVVSALIRLKVKAPRDRMEAAIQELRNEGQPLNLEAIVRRALRGEGERVTEKPSEQKETPQGVPEVGEKPTGEPSTGVPAVEGSEETPSAGNAAQPNDDVETTLKKANEAAKEKMSRARSPERKAEIGQEHRLDALRGMLPVAEAGKEPPKELHVEVDPATGEKVVKGELDLKNNPVHRAFADEFGLSPDHEANLEALQNNIGRGVYLREYHSAAQEGFEEGGADLTAQQRRQEYKASKPGEVGEREGDVSAQDKAVTPLSIIQTKTGLLARVFDHGQFLGNLRAIIDAAHDIGFRTGYEDLHGQELDDQVAADVRAVAANHAAGADATGSKKLKLFPDMTEGKEGPTSPVDPARAKVINMAFANESAKEPKAPKVPASGEVAPSVQAEYEARKDRAKEARGLADLNLGYNNKGETNELRDQLAQNGFDTKTLKPTVVSVRPDLIKGGVHDTPSTEADRVHAHGFNIKASELTREGLPRKDFTAAGFHPGGSDEVAVERGRFEKGDGEWLTARLRNAHADAEIQNGVMNIGMVDVAPWMERQGVGTSLVRKLEAEALKAGATRVTGDAWTESVPFWKKLGYQVGGKSRIIDGALKISKNLSQGDFHPGEDKDYRRRRGFDRSGEPSDHGTPTWAKGMRGLRLRVPEPESKIPEVGEAKPKEEPPNLEQGTLFHPGDDPQTKTPEFKNWFGESKVVDDKGAPLRMFHGTYSGFDKFKRRPGDIGLHFGTADAANDRIAYQVPHRSNQDGENPGQRVVPVYLKIEHPLRMPDAGLWDKDNMDYLLEKQFPQDAETVADLKTPADIRRFLQWHGYDGIVYRNTGEVSGAEPFRERIRMAKEAMDKVFLKGKNSFSPKDQQVPEYKEWSAAEEAYRKHREASQDDSYIAFEPTQVKSATGNRGTFDPKNSDITFHPGGNEMPTEERQKNFEKWTGGAPVIPLETSHHFIPAGPVVVEAVHGTTHDFNIFDPSKGNMESDWGQGIYLSNTPEDVKSNYAGEGPDLTNRLEREADYVHNIEDPDEIAERYGLDEKDAERIATDGATKEEAMALARKRLTEHQGATMKVYAKFENPLHLGTKDEPYWDIQHPMDEEGEFIDEEPSGAMADFIRAIRNVSSRYEDADPEPGLEDFAYDGGKASDVIKSLKDSLGGALDVDTGELASSEIIRKAIERMGYDGIIDATVDRKFGSQRRLGQGMQGMHPDTIHYIAFDPKQIKSATGNRGTFDPNNPDITFHPGADPQTESAEFKKWFGDSKVVKDGKPLRVYHGTSDEIDSFDLDHPNRKDTGWLGNGVYLTTDPELAKSYSLLKGGKAGPNILPLYAKLENPYHATIADKQRLQIISHRDGQEAGREASQEWSRNLQKQGYDGVILEYHAKNVGEKNASSEIVVFDPRGVKSATGNRGTFNPKNPDIRFHPGAGEESRISTRFPKGKDAEDYKAKVLTGSLDNILNDEGHAERIADVLRSAPIGLPKQLLSRNNKKTIRNVLQFFTDNRRFLYNKWKDEPWFQRATQQYVGYHKYGHKLAGEIGFTPEAVIASASAMSPQRSPDMGFSMTKRLGDIINLRDNVTPFNDAMLEKGISLPIGRMKSGEWHPVNRQIYLDSLQRLRGKKFSDLTDPIDQAIFARIHDETFNPDRGYPVIGPEGTEVGIERNKPKKPGELGQARALPWQTFDTIAKGIHVLQGGHPSDVLKSHKISNFYNNQIAPRADLGDYTSDTHDLGTALLRSPYKDMPALTKHFGGPFNGPTGETGGYALGARSGIDLAREVGMLPQELQAGLWTGQQLNMSGDALSPVAVDKIDGIWQDVRRGRLSIEDARNEVYETAQQDLAGHKQQPIWVRSSDQVAPDAGDAGDAGELHRSGGTSGRYEPRGGGGSPPTRVTGDIPEFARAANFPEVGEAFHPGDQLGPNADSDPWVHRYFELLKKEYPEGGLVPTGKLTDAEELEMDKLHQQAEKEFGSYDAFLKAHGHKPHASFDDFHQARIAPPPNEKKISGDFHPGDNPQLDTLEFKRWFGDSKVVKDGKPLMLAHGTYFNTEFQRRSGMAGHFGTTATANERLRQMKEDWNPLNFPADGNGARLIPVHLSIKNPVRMTDVHFDGAREMVEDLVDRKIITEEEADAIAPDYTYSQGPLRAVIRLLEKKGYDGIVYKNNIEGRGSDSWIPFKPTQIKSAIGNRGTFNPKNPDITFHPGASDHPRAIRGPAMKLSNGTLTSVAGTDAQHFHVVQKVDDEHGKLAADKLLKGAQSGWTTNENEFLDNDAAEARAIEMGQATKAQLDKAKDYFGTKQGPLEGGSGLESLAFNRVRKMNPPPPQNVRARQDRPGIPELDVPSLMPYLVP